MHRPVQQCLEPVNCPRMHFRCIYIITWYDMHCVFSARICNKHRTSITKSHNIEWTIKHHHIEWLNNITPHTIELIGELYCISYNLRWMPLRIVRIFKYFDQNLIVIIYSVNVCMYDKRDIAFAQFIIEQYQWYDNASRFRSIRITQSLIVVFRG